MTDDFRRLFLSPHSSSQPTGPRSTPSVQVLSFVDLSLHSNEQHITRVVTAKVQTRLRSLVESRRESIPPPEPESAGLRLVSRGAKLLARIGSPGEQEDEEGARDPALETANRMQSLGAGSQVAFVLEGSLRAEGSRARLAANLVSATEGTRLWSVSYDLPLHDLRTRPEVVADRLSLAAFEVMQKLLAAE